MDETDEFKAMMERARKDILAQLAINSVLKDITVTDEEMQAFYKRKPPAFCKKGETVHAKHILVDSEEKAQDIMNKITAGDIYFEARREGIFLLPSNAQGGDLGEFGKGQMVPEFDQAVFAAEVGKVVGPVKTQFGYHRLRLRIRRTHP